MVTNANLLNLSSFPYSPMIMNFSQGERQEQARDLIFE